MNKEKKKQEELIPPGPYCYVIDFTKEDQNTTGVPVRYCPYHSKKEFNGVKVPWCLFLNEGGTDNYFTDEQWEKLVDHFGSDDNIFNFLPLDLLWDSCKQCSVKNYHSFTKEHIINYITKLNEHE